MGMLYSEQQKKGDSIMKKQKQETADSIENSAAKIKELSVAASTVTKFILTIVFADIAINVYFFMRNIISGKGLDDIVKFAEEIIRWGIYTIMLFSVSKMFKKISEEGTPFRDHSVKCLNTVGILFMLNSCVPSYISGIIIGITSSFENANFSVSLDNIIIGAIFLLLAKIFSYGCILQQESDETL